MAIAEDPATNISESLVKCDELSYCALLPRRHGTSRVGLFNRHEIVPSKSNHVVSKFLPENNSLALPMLEDVPTGLHLACSPIFFHSHSKLLRRDNYLRKASLAIILEELDGFCHWERLHPILVRLVLTANDVSLGTANEYPSRRKQGGLAVFRGWDISKNASNTT